MASHVLHPYGLQEWNACACRSPTADVVLDHPSLSRQHAAVCYNRLRREWVVLDLDSAHGTQADGRPAAKVRLKKKPLFMAETHANAGMVSLRA